MTTLAIARTLRAASVVLAHVSCTTHEPVVARYGDMETCRDCGTVLRDETPGVGDLDRRYANGEIDFDEWVETRDMHVGHP